MIDLPPMRTLDIDGPLAYQVWDGPADTTFVLVHGLGGMHLNWIQVADGLSGLGRVVAPDLPGFGDSPLAGRSAHVMALRRTLAAFIDATTTGRVVVAGNSMGGAIAALQAAIAPDSVQGLILTNPALPKIGHAWQHPSLAALMGLYEVPMIGDLAVKARARALDPEQIVRLGFRLITADPAAIPADVVRLHVEAVGRHAGDPNGVRAFSEATRSLLAMARQPERARAVLDAITCPVLLIHGRRDPLIPARFAEAELRRHPTWRGRILPGVGHVAQMEAPGRWLTEVADWFAGSVD